MSFFGHLGVFLLVTFIVALVVAVIRLEAPRQILRESVHFLATITLGIGVFCLIVYVVEWIFIRPLL